MNRQPSSCAQRLGAQAFGLVNAVVEPLVRAGIGSPGLWPSGAIVLETTGRRTGRELNVPVLAALVGDLVLVATVRPSSQWIANVAARPEIHYWLAGRRRAATALVVTPDTPDASRQIAPGAPPLAAALASALEPWSRLWGMSFAILSPGHAGAA